MSLYDYANGDPVNNLDPDGRCVGKVVNYNTQSYLNSPDSLMATNLEYRQGYLGALTDSYKGAVYGDYAQDTGFAGVVGQVGAGFTPVGWAGDIRDWTAGASNISSNGLNWCNGTGLFLSTVAFVPGAGDAFKGIFKPLANKLGDASVAKIESSLWTKAEFNGTKVYQRNDLIDAELVDARGRTNLQRMQSGLAPRGADGKSLNLHHMLQTSDGPLAEMTATFHQQNSNIIHINPSTTPSGIDRPAFDLF